MQRPINVYCFQKKIKNEIKIKKSIMQFYIAIPETIHLKLMYFPPQVNALAGQSL